MSSEVVFQNFFLEDCELGLLAFLNNNILFGHSSVLISGWFAMGRVRRSRMKVIFDILSECLDGANKTRLMYRCNLNFVRFNRYLQELLDAGLVERVDVNPGVTVLYRTTSKGRELLKVLRKASELLSV